MAVGVRAVAAERSDVSLPRHGEQLGLGIVVLNDPTFGPVLDGEKVGVEGGCDGVAVSGGLDRGPDRAVVGKHVEVVFHNRLFSTTSQRSLMKIMNRRGARTLP